MQYFYDKAQISSNGLLTTIEWELCNTTVITGATFQWLRDDLGIIENYNKIDEYAAKVEDSGDFVFVPAFVGLGAPYWDSSTR